MKDNKLIAEFMGWNTTDCDEVFTEPSGMMDTYTTAEMQWKTDWNWLMDVVDKIEEQNELIGAHILSTDIGKTHKEVVRFIKEYNNDTI